MFYALKSWRLFSKYLWKKKWRMIPTLRNVVTTKKCQFREFSNFATEYAIQNTAKHKIFNKQTWKWPKLLVIVQKLSWCCDSVKCYCATMDLHNSAFCIMTVAIMRVLAWCKCGLKGTHATSNWSGWPLKAYKIRNNENKDAKQNIQSMDLRLREVVRQHGGHLLNTILALKV